MSTDWAAVAADVAAGLGEVAQAVTLKRATGETYDTDTGTVTSAGPETQACSGVEEQYSAFSIAQGLVLAGDKKFLLSPLNAAGQPISPPIADVHTLTLADGSTWAIKKVDPLAPAGTPVLFELQLRGA